MKKKAPEQIRYPSIPKSEDRLLLTGFCDVCGDYVEVPLTKAGGISEKSGVLYCGDDCRTVHEQMQSGGESTHNHILREVCGFNEDDIYD